MPWWTPRGGLPTECIARNAISMWSLGDNVVSIVASIFMFAQTRKKTRKKRLVALILTSLSTHSLGKNLDYAAAVVCGSMHACSHLCAGMESRWCARSQGEHISHQTRSSEKQSGRRRRHSSRRSCEGNGSDVCSVVV